MPVLSVSTIDDMKTLIENALSSAGITFEEYFYNNEYHFFFSGFATTRAYIHIRLTSSYVYLYDCDDYTVTTDESGNVTDISTTNQRTIGSYRWGSGNAFYTDVGDMVFMAWYYSGYRYLVIQDVNCFDGVTRTVAGVNAFKIVDQNTLLSGSVTGIGGKDLNDELRLTKAILTYSGVYYAILDNVAVYNLNFGDIVLIDGTDYYFCVDVGNLLVKTVSDTANNYVGHFVDIFSVDSEIYEASFYTEVDLIGINDVISEIYEPSFYTEVDLFSAVYVKAIYSKVEISKS
ncbi:MAG: hypothetical protein J7J61_05510 [Candidatus Hydrothermae bacterium]|nr:hypothetical protein [Candidatus Hydrothermae bacterium]